jgi:acyl-CoA thioesterase
MQFSQTLSSMQPLVSGWSAVIGEDWSQGRACFGGIVTALGNEAMRRLVPTDRKLRALQTTFVGPALAGSVRLEAQLLRIGKVVTIAESRLWSANQVAATFTGIYGADRASSISVSPKPAPPAVRVEELPDSARPPDAGGPPSFLQHFSIRWGEGTRPFTGTTLNRSRAYIRHKDIAPLTESHVVALIDCIPSVILQMMTRVAPSSSMDWTLQFLRHDYTHAPDAWWRIDSEVNAAADGYSSESSIVYDPTGAPAALSRQLVAVFG